MNDLSNFRQPIIILGFHHSGTRLLAELLEQSGLFQVGMGLTYEWKYFQDLNDRIWESWWDLNGISVEELQRRSNRIDVAQLLASLELHGYKNGPWGFKDPRTCTTLAAWLKAFPQAKAIHIVRDPRDVLGTLPGAYSKFTPKNAVPQDALEFWSNLWVDNITMVEQVGPKCAAFSTLKYEDLCADPMQELERVVKELEMESAMDVNKAKTGSIRSKDKKHLNWIREGKLDIEQVGTIEAITKDQMQHYGYNS